MRKIWSKEEESFIEENLSTFSIKELSNLFEVPYQKVVDKIHKMGLNSKESSGVLWKKSEDDILLSHFEYAPKDLLLSLLPERKWNAIWQRGRKKFNLSRKTKDRTSVNYRFFDDWSPVSAYIYGYIMADGHIHLGKNNYLQIDACITDIGILEKIKIAMNYQGKIYLTHNGEAARIQINNINIIEQLAKKGIPLKDKSYIAALPEILPKEYERDCIRGLIDGDGWSRIDKDGYYNIGLCGTRELVSKVKSMLPIDCSANKIRKTGPNNWRFNIKCKKARNIASWLYEDAEIFMDRKYNEYIKSIKLHSPLLEKSSRDTTLKPVTP